MTNIALVVLDTLRVDAFQEHFDWLPGKRFSNAYSTSHWTVPAHASLFTGKYASEVGVYAGNQFFDCGKSALAELLQDAGYTTRALSTNVNVSRIFGFDRGFEHFESLGRHNQQLRHITDPQLFDWSQYVNTGLSGYFQGVIDCIRSNCATVPSLRQGIDLKFDFSSFNSQPGANDMGANQVLERIQTIDFGTDEFLFINLMETHTPYEIPDDYKTISTFEVPDNPVGKVEGKIDLGPVKTRYDDAANYLSDIYHEIFDVLIDSFDMIITVSDHGELLGEFGYYGHSHSIRPPLTHVPLSIYTGKHEKNVGRCVSLLDLHTTTLAAAGIDDQVSRGVDLLSEESESGDVLTEYHGIPHPDRELSGLHDWADSEAVFDSYQQWKRGIALPGGCYGYETRESFDTNGECNDATPEQRLKEAVDRLTVVNRDSDGDREIPDSVKEELRHLGYL